MTQDKESDMTYRNDYCPDVCTMMHEVPIGNVVGTFTCPDSNERYYWCNACDDWEWDCGSTHVRIDDRWYCDPEEHGYVRCLETDCGRWVQSHEANSPCYNDDATFCNGCWNGCDCDACDPHDGDMFSDYAFNCDEGEERNLCPTCHSMDEHLDLLDEEFFCKCAVKAILETDPEHPFRLARPLAEVMA